MPLYFSVIWKKYISEINIFLKRNIFFITVVSSIKDPIPGWIENFNGPTGIIVACGKGTLILILRKNIKNNMETLICLSQK